MLIHHEQFVGSKSVLKGEMLHKGEGGILKGFPEPEFLLQGLDLVVEFGQVSDDVLGLNGIDLSEPLSEILLDLVE